MTDPLDLDPRLRAVRHATSDVATPADLRVALQEVVDVIAAQLPADRVSLFGIDTLTERVTDFHVGGPGAGQVVPVDYDELWRGLSGWVLRERLPALSPAGLPDPRESPAVQRRRMATRCGDIVVVPLLAGDRLLGTLTAINAVDGTEFDSSHVALLTAMADRVAAGIAAIRFAPAVHGE